MPKRYKLHKIASDFRGGILGTMPSALMCFAVCAPLEGFLRVCGYDVELVEGTVELPNGRVAQHYWLALPDGRVLDPTADQFTKPTGEPMPEVYIGERPGWYLTAEEAEEFQLEESAARLAT
jgi:hypothetical protein